MREKGASQATLIGLFEPPTTPICWNSNGVNPMTHGVFVLSAVCAVRVKQATLARSGADKVNVFQYLVVDVLLFMTSILVLIFVTIFYLPLIMFRILAGGVHEADSGDSTKHPFSEALPEATSMYVHHFCIMFFMHSGELAKNSTTPLQGAHLGLRFIEL
ncbi:hypothetical protein Y032_0085g1812 [Ancylostoma ceylanicum]|uniref:Uncharacterized protein n=1 Tax=Ancylostoma ceylanicum TaxID=53326 RepID=A0A016TQ98_9BILA|nr:hypothetical protein Y032_0085g1812 [Ancylostoma ceylanicum]